MFKDEDPVLTGTCKRLFYNFLRYTTSMMMKSVVWSVKLKFPLKELPYPCTMHIFTSFFSYVSPVGF